MSVRTKALVSFMAQITHLIATGPVGMSTPDRAQLDAHIKAVQDGGETDAVSDPEKGHSLIADLCADFETVDDFLLALAEKLTPLLQTPKVEALTLTDDQFSQLVASVTEALANGMPEKVAQLWPAPTLSAEQLETLTATVTEKLAALIPPPVSLPDPLANDQADLLNDTQADTKPVITTKTAKA